MEVGKWGSSLGVRLPATVVEALGVKEGDDIEIEVAGTRALRASRDDSRAGAVRRLQSMQRPLLPGFRFTRDEAHER